MMADYTGGIQFLDAQSFHLDPNFTSNDTPYPTSPGIRRTSHVTHASSPSWISSFPPYSRPSSGRPPLPSPAINTRIMPDSQQQKILRLVTERDNGEQPPPEHLPEMDAEPEWDPFDTEEMIVGASGESEHVEEGYGQPVWNSEPGPSEGPAEPAKHKGKAKTFVGGFVKRLGRLPRAISRGQLLDRKPPRKGTLGLGLSDEPESTTPLPRYDDPGQPVPNLSNVHYVEGMEMPVAPPSGRFHEQQAEQFSWEQPSGGQLSYSYEHPSAQLSYVDEEASADIPGNNLDAPLENPYEHSQVPGQQQDDATVMAGRGHITPPPAAFLSTPVAVNSPVQVNPLPTADYVRMESRERPLDDSFSAHITRARTLLVDLRNLPWISYPVAVDYFPSQSSRARSPEAKPNSWYYTTRQHQELDLIGTSPAKPLVRPHIHRGDDSTRMRMIPHAPTTYGSLSEAARQVGDSPATVRGQHSLAYSQPYHTPPAHTYPSPESQVGTDPTPVPTEIRQVLPAITIGTPPPSVLRTPISPGGSNTPTRVPYSVISPNSVDISLPR
ncbi:hypothetical protein SCP_0900530 [Sparassis crispa]|uniref:Uncharacterized protein n=1 Tax=Sparassis crispa TaxID=139825 RepID=A0A401GVE9_9APHY|nr:hypothetical protein SCP_0900530 [Sparassis crispa]GBE86176.1 hypothetical protein SCP_0900530 [Sparassis crispa]